MRKSCAFFKCRWGRTLGKLQHFRALYSRNPAWTVLSWNTKAPQGCLPANVVCLADQCGHWGWSWKLVLQLDHNWCKGSCVLTAQKQQQLLSISLWNILSVARSVIICLRVSVLADFPTHAYLRVFQMASCSPWHCTLFTGQLWASFWVYFWLLLVKIFVFVLGQLWLITVTAALDFKIHTF